MFFQGLTVDMAQGIVEEFKTPKLFRFAKITLIAKINELRSGVQGRVCLKKGYIVYINKYFLQPCKVYLS